MSRTHPVDSLLAIYALGLVAVGLIIYILSVLLSDEEPARASDRSSIGIAQDNDNLADLSSLTSERQLEDQPIEQTQGLVYQADTADIEAALPSSETAPERSARLIRETLGVENLQGSDAAVNVDLLLAENCVIDEGEQTSLPILYRFESPTIRTSSLYELRSLLTQYRRCKNSVFRMSQNTQRGVKSNINLAQMRVDELKYFFTQNSVPQSALLYPEYP